MHRLSPALLFLLPLAVWTCNPDEEDEAGVRRSTGATSSSSSSSSSGSFCVEECGADGDCLSGFRCQRNRCVPQDPPDTCTSDLQCTARASGWSPCPGENGTCTVANYVCVVASGPYCALTPSAQPCSASGMEEITLPRQDGQGNVTVCAIPRQKCGSGVCFTGCRNDGDCGGEYPACNPSSGRCECREGSCTTNASVCSAGRCRCADDSDCTINADLCQDGACGCASTAACTLNRAHPRTSWVCEAP
ncbi:MAG: hypothetical protein AB2A00_22315 [Myxococcota bacterium]